MRLAALAGAVALFAACAGGPAEGDRQASPTPATEPAQALPLLPIGGDFELVDQDARPFKLEQLRGKVVLLFFGYTMCPDACPTTLSKLSTAYSRLSPEERALVKAVYVTIDPERDTAEVMKTHLTYFGVDAIGLTGAPEQIAQVASLYKASYEKSDAKTAGGYLMSHTVSLFGIDAQGKTRTVIDYEASVDLVVTEIRRLLNAPKVDDLRQPGTLPSL